MATEFNGQGTNGNAPLEKDFHLGSDQDAGEALQKIRTAGSISISPELFEKVYLSPQNKVKGDLRKTFANPTPLCLIGFLLSLFPLSFALLEWRGAGGLGVATIGAYWFSGGLLMVLGSIGEFLLGNTFPFVVFGSFGSFWLVYATTVTPYFQATVPYGVTDGATDAFTAANEGLMSAGFNHSFAYFTLSMGILCFLYLICALRTNIVFVLIFLCLVTAFGLLTGQFLQIPDGDPEMLMKMQHAAGSFTFITCILGWYLFFSIMLAAVDFPVALPVGDLSTMIKPMSEKIKERKGTDNV